MAGEHRPGAVPGRVLVFGLGVAGQSVVTALLRRGHDVVTGDDRPEAAAIAARLGVPFGGSPADAGLVVPAPGVPADHPVLRAAAAAGVPIWSEFELAARWSRVPTVAITGTNGKTTVTNLVTAMLAGAGKKVTSAGNTDVPLVDVLDDDLDLIVVEASSFRLEFTETFRPSVGTWLNISEDHRDWHPSFEAYAAAKARIWACQDEADTAIANADDAIVSGYAAHARSRLRRFSVEGVADWWWDKAGGQLVGPDGPFVPVMELPRHNPHDLANALAAAATASAAGAPVEVAADVLRGFRGFQHRVALVGEALGVRWYDDSKATTPASVLAAVTGFESVVLIAGGRNKGLDLGALSGTVPPVHAVVAIGDAAGEVQQAFAGLGVSVALATSMAEAVAAAQGLAEPGDAVLLSPGCASFDWYHDYMERGDDFARLVLELTGAEPAPALPAGGH